MSRRCIWATVVFTCGVMTISYGVVRWWTVQKLVGDADLIVANSCQEVLRSRATDAQCARPLTDMAMRMRARIRALQGVTGQVSEMILATALGTSLVACSGYLRFGKG